MRDYDSYDCIGDDGGGEDDDASMCLGEITSDLPPLPPRPRQKMKFKSSRRPERPARWRFVEIRGMDLVVPRDACWVYEKPSEPGEYPERHWTEAY